MQEKLREYGRSAKILDKDTVNTNLCQGLGFTKDDHDVSV
ncbi:MAG: hypothetical protein B6D35_06315 [Candidatus Brocadia sp. UTAMX2]|nr:MAG: hypothetical protein B6D35_06315 [Candidatus Brocadia sp. UTAMX2]